MSGVVWRLRWRVATSRRRLVAWNVIVPVLLLLPVAVSPAAAPHRAAVVGVFVVFFGTFGSCIPLVRDRARGWSEKVRLTGYGARRWLGERVVAETALDLAELLPALALVLAVAEPATASIPARGGSAGVVLAAAAAVALALLAANFLGALVAACVTSIAEAALVCSAAALFALHFSGLFRSAAPDSWTWQVERIAPFHPLVEALGAGLAGPEATLPSFESYVGPALATAAVASITLSAAGRLARRGTEDRGA